MNLRPLILPLLLAACSPPPPQTAPAAPASAPSAKSAPAVAAIEDAKPDAAILGRYHWQLRTAVNHDGEAIGALLVRPDAPLQLDFSAGRVAISHACNRIGADATVEGDTLTLSDLMQTKMACADAQLMQLDRAVAEHLPGIARVQLAPDAGAPHLTLTYGDGDVLTFIGDPTAATLYGSDGQTVFLEVAANTVPCPAPASDGAQCLNVRERHYDANGLRAGSDGDWHALPAHIQGYVHEPGMRNVLRVKRYALKQPAADGARYAWVLDMVVESEGAAN